MAFAAQRECNQTKMICSKVYWFRFVNNLNCFRRERTLFFIVSCPDSDLVAPAKYRCRMSHRSFRRAALKEQAGSGRALTFISVPWTARPSLLLGQPKAVAFPQLLAGRRRAEIGVATADDRERPVGGAWGRATVAGLRSVSRHPTRRTMFTQPGDQPANLPRRQFQSFRRTQWLELAGRHVLSDLEPVLLAHRHRDPLRCSHRSLRRGAPGGPSAYAARKWTFLTRPGH